MKSITVIRRIREWMLIALGALAVCLGAHQAAFTETITSPSVSLAPTAASQAASQAALQSAAQSGGAITLEPLPIQLPRPVELGTLKELRGVNLEPYNRSAVRAAPMVPKGCVVLSLKKPVTSSDDSPIVGSLDMITDGGKEARDGDYVELGPGRQWVQIDLEKTCEIYAILIWHNHQDRRAYRDVAVQVSEDSDFITGVKTLFNNDIDNSLGLGIGANKEYVEDHQGKLVEARGVKARYARLYSNGGTAGDGNHYTEVEIWGKAAVK
ncbi:MAG: hypothetical protein NTX50_27640 [Candidatus Sumerlaeota bacterium]|nr:hypothetical protein [Candidatus Sumerlaeota bacterium]